MYRIGIDLGGTNIVVGLVEQDFRIVDKCSVKTQVPRSVESMAADMAQMAWTLLERNRLLWQDVASVGVGVPGTANPENGHMEDANNLGFDDVPFLPLLAEKIPMPVHFGNDANVAAWGEYLAGGYQEDSFVMVTVGTGIGGGVSRAGEALLRPLREEVARRVYSRNSKRNTRIELAKLDNDAGILGAALLGSGRQKHEKPL